MHFKIFTWLSVFFIYSFVILILIIFLILQPLSASSASCSNRMDSLIPLVYALCEYSDAGYLFNLKLDLSPFLYLSFDSE